MQKSVLPASFTAAGQKKRPMAEYQAGTIADGLCMGNSA